MKVPESTLGCDCTLNDGGAPPSDNKKAAVLFQQNLELECVEVVLLIFDSEPLVGAVEKPGWLVEHQSNLKSHNVSPYAAFPNPPPLCS